MHRVLFTIKEMGMGDPNFFYQPGPQIFSETGGMIRWQPNVFVEMKQFDSFPGNFRQAGKSVQQFELGCARGCDQAGSAILLDRLTNGVGSLLGGGVAERKFIGKDLYDHGRPLMLRQL
jgi:hypothetical protein